MDKEVAKAINDLSKKINDMGQKLDSFINSQTEKNKANIDYVAMMSDIDIPTESEVDNEQEV